MSAMQTEPSGQKQVAERAEGRNGYRKCLPQAILYILSLFSLLPLSCYTFSRFISHPFIFFYLWLYKPVFFYIHIHYSDMNT